MSLYRAYLRANPSLKTIDGLYLRDRDFVCIGEVCRLIEAHSSETHALREETVYDLDEDGDPYPLHYDEDQEDENWTPAMIEALPEASRYLRDKRRRELAELLGVDVDADGGEALLDRRLDDPTVLFALYRKSMPAARLCDDDRVNAGGFHGEVSLAEHGARLGEILRAIGVRPGDARYSHHRLQASQAQFYVGNVLDCETDDDGYAAPTDSWLFLSAVRRWHSWFSLVRPLRARECSFRQLELVFNEDRNRSIDLASIRRVVATREEDDAPVEAFIRCLLCSRNGWARDNIWTDEIEFREHLDIACVRSCARD